MLYDCDSTLQLQTNDLDIDTMYEIRVKEAAWSAVLFISIVTMQIQDVNRFLEKFFKRLETRNSKLEPRNSILDSRKHRVSRIEFQVETVNLHLTGTVRRGCYTSWNQEKKHFEMVLKSQTNTPQDHMSFWICSSFTYSIHVTNILTKTVSFKWAVNYSEIFIIENGSAILMNMSFQTVLTPF